MSKKKDRTVDMVAYIETLHDYLLAIHIINDNRGMNYSSSINNITNLAREVAEDAMREGRKE